VANADQEILCFLSYLKTLAYVFGMLQVKHQQILRLFDEIFQLEFLFLIFMQLLHHLILIKFKKKLNILVLISIDSMLIFIPTLFQGKSVSFLLLIFIFPSTQSKPNQKPFTSMIIITNFVTNMKLFQIPAHLKLLLFIIFISLFIQFQSPHHNLKPMILPIFSQLSYPKEIDNMVKILQQIYALRISGQLKIHPQKKHLDLNVPMSLLKTKVVFNYLHYDTFTLDSLK
jgi:hypothetical protein